MGTFGGGLYMTGGTDLMEVFVDVWRYTASSGWQQV